jgi:hypothetical protein
VSRSAEISACGLPLRVVEVPILGHQREGDSRVITYVYERTGRARDPIVATAGLHGLILTASYANLDLDELTTAVTGSLGVAA